MTFDRDNLIESILSSIDRMDYTKSEDIPNLDLYMDQLITFMEKKLSNTKRNPDDKIMTKTMVNNYAKSGLLPPPEKKKYNKDHIMILFFIYYFKNILSINDIKKLLGPIETNYFNQKSGLKLSTIYDEVFQTAMKQTEDLKKFVEEKTDIALKSCKSLESSDEEFLHYFTFICTLSFDAYVKRLMIEKLIDLLPDEKK
ncbi:MAG: DUF1836 domain-containing protein [Lachnospiraceae bacterium]|nr:DUF1836 domain-containing protein [Lachnospiraceae bacterium]